MIEVSEQLTGLVSRAAEGLRSLSDEDASRPLAPGKWSPKEVLGHLIDSAANNHRRFVEAQGRDELRFPGYAQNEWIERQRYGAAPWSDLVELWSAYNRHLAHVIAHVSEDDATRPRTDHNLHEIAWESPRAGEPVTLAFFVRDYVNHLAHHLRQIDEALADEPVAQLAHGRRKSS